MAHTHTHAHTHTQYHRYLVIEKCPFNKFRCTRIHQCIFRSQRCDGRKQCWDGTDEFGCPRKPSRFDFIKFQSALFPLSKHVIHFHELSSKKRQRISQ